MSNCAFPRTQGPPLLVEDAVYKERMRAIRDEKQWWGGREREREVGKERGRGRRERERVRASEQACEHKRETELMKMFWRPAQVGQPERSESWGGDE